MKDDIDGRYDIPEEDISDVGFFENSLAEISPDNDSIFARDLLPRENIIVTAQGKTGKGSLFKRIFTVFWVMFVIVWELAAISSSDGFGAVFGLPHTLVGIMLLLQSGFIPAKVTIAVTDKRVLIRSMGKTQAVYLEKAGKAMILPSDNDDCWNLSFEGIKGFFEQNRNESGNTLFDTFELSREDAVKIEDIINNGKSHIIISEYINGGSHYG